MKYSRILTEFYNTPWAILPEKLAVITDLLVARSLGIRMSDEEIKSLIGAVEHPTQNQVGSVAVIPVYGVLAQRMDLLGAMSGGTSTERLAKQIKTAVDDSAVGTILLDIDSPGGSVFGISEVSNIIFEARKHKKITAIANSLSASAAYWIGSAAEDFVITPGGEAGSIGVLAAHEDISQFEENMGVKTTLISAGKFKVEGNPFEPLTDEAKAAIQSRIDDYYDMFVKAVAKHRDVSVSDVRNGFAEGRVVGAKEANSLGMVDRIATFDETVDRLAGSKRAQKPKTRLNAANLKLIEMT